MTEYYIPTASAEAELVEKRTIWLCLKTCLSRWMNVPETSIKIFHFF